MNPNHHSIRRLGVALPTLIASLALLSAGGFMAWRGAPVSPRQSVGMTGAGAAPSAPSDHPATAPSTSSAASDLQEQNTEVLKFFETHTPNRFRAYVRVKDAPAGRLLFQRMSERHRRLMRIRSEDAELYSIMVEQMEIQDEAFMMIRRQQVAPDAEELRIKVRKMVDLSIQERQRRIARLEKMLAEQKASLEQDSANREALVDKHIKQMFQDAKDFQRLWNPNASSVGGGGRGGR